MKKVAVVIGHHEKQKGALSKYFGLREFDFYSEVVKHIDNVDVFTHDSNISGYKTRIKNTAKKLNDYDLVIELHFNSFGDNSVGGCETLYYCKSVKGEQYAKTFSKYVHDATNIQLRNNGIKALSNINDRGFASVYYPLPPTILIEPFFGSNNDDCKKIESAENLACIINNFLNNI